MAGSERHGKTGNYDKTILILAFSLFFCENFISSFQFFKGISNDSGQKFTESKSINLSLSTLGKVIQCLSTDKPGHVPYRESKLTRILQVEYILQFINLTWNYFTAIYFLT